MHDLFTNLELAHRVKYLIEKGLYGDQLLIDIASPTFCVSTSHFVPYGKIPCRFCDHNRTGHRNVFRNHYFSSKNYVSFCRTAEGTRNTLLKEFLMKRPEPAKTPKGKNEPCPDKAFAKDYPIIATYLCDAFWDDGKPRKQSSLGVKMEQGAVAITLSDHEFEQSCYTVGETLQDALGLLEQALKDEKNVWRKWKRGK